MKKFGAAASRFLRAASISVLCYGLVWEGALANDQSPACASESPDLSRLDSAKRFLDEEGGQIHSMIVQHCGRRVFEDYRLGFDSIMPHDLQSATKTYSMLLIGVLIEHGDIESVDTPLKKLLPDYAHLLSGEKADITLRHVLSMTSGLAWRDFGKGNSFEKIIAAEDTVEFVLSEPLKTKPGETFFYNTGSSHLLSAIITEQSGMSAFEFAKETLFEPLEMMDYEWDEFADGLSLGGWGLYSRPRDMAKVGQLILDGGAWEGRQIVNADFVDDARRQQTETGAGVGGGGYGYQMWIPDGFSKTQVAAALGFGGQSIYVFGDLDLVVVFTASVEKPQENAALQARVLSQFVVPQYSDADLSD